MHLSIEFILYRHLKLYQFANSTTLSDGLPIKKVYTPLRGNIFFKSYLLGAVIDLHP